MTARRQRFPARADALPRVSAFVERRCRELGADRRAALRLILVAEELFINTIMHGYGGNSSRPVSLAVRRSGREIVLVAEDGGPAFDPFRGVGQAPAVARSGVGGLGRVLVAGIASRQHYERRGGRNRVTVWVLKDGARAARASAHKKK